MSKVLYRQGLKATYLSLIEKDPNALYFCTDTRELYRGNDLYSDGIRLVESFAAMPGFSFAADGILYFCKDTGSGYVLSEDRSEWIPVIHGIDNASIALNENGLLSVKSVSIATVGGLEERLQSIEEKIVTAGNTIIPSDEFVLDEDGVLSIKAVEQHKVVGLEDRLSGIEQSVVGGIKYCGAVQTYDDLPTNAEVGHLYEVYEDNSEWCWNGNAWFEYGKTVNIPTIEEIVGEVCNVVSPNAYEINAKPIGTLVNYTDDEVRVMCPSDTAWSKQAVGANGDANIYYIGFRAYAPAEAESFKEDLAEVIADSTMYYFEGNDFAGIDEYGRKYSQVWLPAARYDETADAWTYFGASSSKQRYIGWYYTVEWFDTNGIKIATDTVRINLSNEDCHNAISPYYVAEIQSSIAEIEENFTWGDM